GGRGGDATMLGVYFADAGQHLEHRLFVDHNAPKTRSNVDYKGALQGKGAHSVWIGDVLIRKVAEGIETYESNRNLVLTDGCQADSVPNLEIETGEIEGAGHASTTSSCSTCSRGAFPRTTLGDWSCTASSTTSSARSGLPRSRCGCLRPSRRSWPRTWGTDELRAGVCDRRRRRRVRDRGSSRR